MIYSHLNDFFFNKSCSHFLNYIDSNNKFSQINEASHD